MVAESYSDHKTLERVIQELTKMPTIGRRTAQRLAFYLLKASQEEVRSLVDAIIDLKKKVGFCSICGSITESGICSICADEKRDHGIICVVEEPGNVIRIEMTGEYRGVYHVLHGRLSPLDGIGPEQLRIESLLDRIRAGGVREVIIATSPTVEGEATCSYVADVIRPLGVKITTIATGVPIGSDLDLADEITLARALKGRAEIK
ncbi:MAG: recombination mediator RecR [bacterium]